MGEMSQSVFGPERSLLRSALSYESCARSDGIWTSFYLLSLYLLKGIRIAEGVCPGIIMSGCAKLEDLRLFADSTRHYETSKPENLIILLQYLPANGPNL
jgi:hypothetical protein